MALTDTDGRSLWALLDTIYFQEVEPDTGAPVVIERLQPLPGALDWDVGRLSDEPEVLRRQNCGNAIRELRKPYHLAALGTGWINGIAGAHELCLAKKPSGMPVSLSASEREHVERCGEAYRAVVEFCFSSDGISWEQQARIAAHVGIIVTPDRGTGSGRTIRCSATRVSGKGKQLKGNEPKRTGSRDKGPIQKRGKGTRYRSFRIFYQVRLGWLAPMRWSAASSIVRADRPMTAAQPQI